MHDSLPGSNGAPMPYRRCGESGFQLPMLGLDLRSATREPVPRPCLIGEALELGVSHMDVTACSATGFSAGQEKVGQLFTPWRSRRDTMVVSARIGLGTQPGPMEGFGSRRQILSSLDGLLRRTRLDYIDILYAHRFDPCTPIEETASALACAVQQGKVLYTGLSSFAPASLIHISTLLAGTAAPIIAYQAPYSLLNRWIEDSLLAVLQERGIGCIASDPTIHQPPYSAADPSSWTKHDRSGSTIQGLARIAAARGQSTDQLAISWVLRETAIAAVLSPAAHSAELAAHSDAARRTHFTHEELAELDLYFDFCQDDALSCPEFRRGR